MCCFGCSLYTVKTISTGFWHGALRDLLAAIELDPKGAPSQGNELRKGCDVHLQEHKSSIKVGETTGMHAT